MPRLGIQLSSVTPYLDTPEKIHRTFCRLAEIGYREVQLQGVSPEIPDSVLTQALRESGLHCVAAQEDYPFGFGENPERAIQRAAACGCRYLTFALLPMGTDTVGKLERFAESLLRIHERVRQAGMLFAFHPIGIDFNLMDGVPVYERLLGLLPNDVQLTFCVYSSFGSGISYEQVLERYAGRVDLVHFKDDTFLPDGKRQLMPLGEGSHDWREVCEACDRAGVKWIFAEQERWNRDAFDCAAASYRYLRSLGLS